MKTCIKPILITTNLTAMSILPDIFQLKPLSNLKKVIIVSERKPDWDTTQFEVIKGVAASLEEAIKMAKDPKRI